MNNKIKYFSMTDIGRHWNDLENWKLSNMNDLEYVVFLYAKCWQDTYVLHSDW